MLRICSFFVFLFAAVNLQAQLNNYSSLTIPDSLHKDADIVIRDENIKLIVKDKNSAKYEVKQVFTVLNERAKHYLLFNEFSDKFHSLEDAEIKTFDKLGNKMNSYSKKEMTSLNYGEGLVPEGKVTYFDVSVPSYPITVEFNYSIKYKGILSLPGFEMQSAWKSIQHTSFEVEVPSELGVRYKLVNTTQQPEITKQNGKDFYKWELNNLKAYKLEKHSGPPDSYVPMVFIGPNKFQLDDYEGDMTSWNNFGAWMDNLYIKTTSLSEEKKTFYRDMVKHVSTNEEKAAILYNYLQSNMRYVSIQLGIGGWRPFPASFVDDKKYGDCKALSNYLKSALDAVGIKSNIVIIQGSNSPRNVMEDFPANYFNHAILCIPQPKDTLWLECTSRTLPFNQIGPFTENRKALMVTDNGGALVNTPVSTYASNTKMVHTVIDVNEDGGAKLKTSFTLFGDERNDMLMGYHDLKEDEKRRFFISNMEWKNPDNFDLSNSKNKANPYQITSTMNYEKMYAFNAGSKLFFSPRQYPIFNVEIVEQLKRMRDYYFTNPFQVIDTTIFKFPAGFSLETMPKNKLEKFPFAQYSANYKWEAASTTLTIIAILQVKERVIKAEDYIELVKFNKAVVADMNEKIVLKRE